MPEAPVAPAAVDPKATAANISKGITDKASGKVPGTAPAAGAPAAPPDPNAGKEKYVVNGKEYYLTPEQAKAYAQKGIAFEPRVSELARLQQETAAFLQTLKTDPEKILFNPKVGLSPKDVLSKVLTSDAVSEETKEIVGRWYYENVVKRAKMTPEQQEALDTKSELAKLKAERERATQEAEQKENQARIARALAQVKAQIAEAMAEAGLPNGDSPLAVQMARRVADVMRLGYVAKKPVTPKEAITKVKAEFRELMKMSLDALDPDKLVEELGAENAEKVRKHFLKLVKQENKVEDKSLPPLKKSGERAVITPDEFRERLEKLKRGEK